MQVLVLVLVIVLVLVLVQLELVLVLVLVHLAQAGAACADLFSQLAVWRHPVSLPLQMQAHFLQIMPVAQGSREVGNYTINRRKVFIWTAFPSQYLYWIWIWDAPVGLFLIPQEFFGKTRWWLRCAPYGHCNAMHTGLEALAQKVLLADMFPGTSLSDV